MSGDRLKWLLVALMFLASLETISRWPASAPCLIGPNDHAQTSQDNQQQSCPAFFRGSLILLSRVDHFVESHDKSIVAVFTVVLAISTILLWRSTDKLWQAGERQMELIASSGAQQSLDMQASIRVAEAAAKAAAKSAEVAERSLIAADRAWLAIELVFSGPLKFGPELIEIDIETRVSNIGRSPATHVQFSTQLFTDVGKASDWIEDQAKRIKRAVILPVGVGQIIVPGDDTRSDQHCVIKREDFIASIKEINETDLGEVEGFTRKLITKDHPCLACFAWYALPAAGPKGEFRFSSEVLVITCPNEGHEGWTGTECEEISEGDLELTPGILGSRAS